jgi:hypothetical protein
MQKRDGGCMQKQIKGMIVVLSESKHGFGMCNVATCWMRSGVLYTSSHDLELTRQMMHTPGSNNTNVQPNGSE